MPRFPSPNGGLFDRSARLSRLGVPATMADFSGIERLERHGTSLSGHRQAPSEGQLRIACEQQDEATLLPQSAVPPLLGGGRKALGSASFEPEGAADHRQERHRGRACRVAGTRGALSERLHGIARVGNNGSTAPASLRPMPYSSLPHPQPLFRRERGAYWGKRHVSPLSRQSIGAGHA